MTRPKELPPFSETWAAEGAAYCRGRNYCVEKEVVVVARGLVCRKAVCMRIARDEVPQRDKTWHAPHRRHSACPLAWAGDDA